MLIHNEMRYPYLALARLAPGLWLARDEDGGGHVLWAEGIGPRPQHIKDPTPIPPPAILEVTALQAGYLLARAGLSR